MATPDTSGPGFYDLKKSVHLTMTLADQPPVRVSPTKLVPPSSAWQTSQRTRRSVSTAAGKPASA
jgi:hypothetical protein